MLDNKVKKIISKEIKRQIEYVDLIASENFVSKDVLEAVGSVLMNKYSEGYPGNKYYGGVENAEEIEILAIERAKKLFNAKFANVQPHSGTSANIAAYASLLQPGDTILGMALDAGGHLSHGHKVSATGIFYNVVQYGVNKKTEELDFKEIERLAIEHRPKVIICGASAYSRIIDFKKFKEIADKVQAYVIADVAHIAGLIVTGHHPNPLDIGIDILTSTTHKTLRGARGGLILTNDEELAIKINKAVFPGIQGGPLVNIIAGKAVAFGEALKPEFKDYIEEVVESARAMANYFHENGIRVVTKGTNNHVFLVDVRNGFGMKGSRAEDLLHYANIVVNKNMIPFDEERPIHTSGIRLGTAAMVTYGFKKNDFIKLAKIIIDILKTNTTKKAEEYQSIILDMLGVK